MQIHNVRLGFANNSSSSHSLIFLDDIPTNDEYTDFGWDFFTASSKESKRNYLAHIIHSNLCNVIGSTSANTVTEQLLGPYNDTSYVDHQSFFSIPRDFTGKFINLDFFNDLKNLFEDENLVILGGNDNTDDEHHLNDGTAFIIPPFLNGVSRKDKLNGKQWYVIFNKETGAKIRLEFPSKDSIKKPNGDDRILNPRYASITPFSVNVDKSATPELVDIKITDYCSFGCEYCYQGSTTQGTHADTVFLSGLAEALGELQVFEVAIGGGEPTLHPNFVYILNSFSLHGITPNFTTKNFQWMRDEEVRPQVLDIIGSFAFSCETHADVIRLSEYCNKYSIPRKKVTVQIIPAILSEYVFQTILKECVAAGFRLTLLGYKYNNRGEQYVELASNPRNFAKHFSHDAPWLDVIKKLREKRERLPQIAVDTVITQKYEKQLNDMGVHSIMYHTQEGKFSMYVDAVNKTCGPSSFCKNEEMIPLEGTYYVDSDQINAAFRRW